MPFAAAADGVRIHYQVEGVGSPLMLLHGMTRQLQAWREFGYVDQLKTAHTLILVDSRGHGMSDKPSVASAYAFPIRVDDLLAVLRHSGLAMPHLWGYSMGGDIAQAAASLAPDSFRSVVMGGSSPYGSRDSAVTGTFEEFWERVRSRVGADEAAWRAVFDVNRAFDGYADSLRTAPLPLLLYAGADDHGHQRGTREFGARYGTPHFIVPDQDHVGAFSSAASVVVPHVLTFLRSVA